VTPVVNTVTSEVTQAVAPVVSETTGVVNGITGNEGNNLPPGGGQELPPPPPVNLPGLPDGPGSTPAVTGSNPETPPAVRPPAANTPPAQAVEIGQATQLGSAIQVETPENAAGLAAALAALTPATPNDALPEFYTGGVGEGIISDAASTALASFPTIQPAAARGSETGPQLTLQPQTNETLADGVAFDSSALDAALTRFVNGCEEQLHDLVGMLSGTGMTPWIVALAIGLMAIEYRRRQARKQGGLADALSERDATLPWALGLGDTGP
jgi:hypothetical protein